MDGVYRNKLVRTHVMRLMQENKTWVLNEFETAKKVQQMAWMPDQSHYEIYDYMLANHCIDAKQNQPAFFFMSIRHNPISNRRYWLSALSAVYAKEEQDRVVEGENKMFEWDNVESESKFIRGLAFHSYTTYFEQQSCCLDHAKMMTKTYCIVQKHVDCQEFCDELNDSIPNREHVGYKLLMTELLAHYDTDKTTPFCKAKLSILIDPITQCAFRNEIFDSDFWEYERYFFDFDLSKSKTKEVLNKKHRNSLSFVSAQKKNERYMFFFLKKKSCLFQKKMRFFCLLQLPHN